jgi:hypothetical protein
MVLKAASTSSSRSCETEMKEDVDPTDEVSGWVEARPP